MKKGSERLSIGVMIYAIKMKTTKGEGRRIKQKVLKALELEDVGSTMEKLGELPYVKVVNALFSFLHSIDQKIKWRAVIAMGAMVAKIADEDMEAARVIVRRLMWNLNDESGGIGWGSPEALGEILACHEGLANEYANILISYTMKDGNYLEHEMLQRGLIWGIGRLAQARPHLIQKAEEYLIAFLESNDGTVRGLAAWVIGVIGGESARSVLNGLLYDTEEIQIYLNQKLIVCQVKDMAVKALENYDGSMNC